MPEDLLSALQELRSWVLLPRSEVAVVLPVRAGAFGPPHLVAVGDATSVPLTPDVVLRSVLRTRSQAYVLIHTHHADVTPGPADLAVTRRLVAASAVVGVRLLGHYVLAPGATYDCLAA